MEAWTRPGIRTTDSGWAGRAGAWAGRRGFVELTVAARGRGRGGGWSPHNRPKLAGTSHGGVAGGFTQLTVAGRGEGGSPT